jgi:hypothetical protein
MSLDALVACPGSERERELPVVEEAPGFTHTPIIVEAVSPPESLPVHFRSYSVSVAMFKANVCPPPAR